MPRPISEPVRAAAYWFARGGGLIPPAATALGSTRAPKPPAMSAGGDEPGLAHAQAQLDRLAHGPARAERLFAGADVGWSASVVAQFFACVSAQIAGAPIESDSCEGLVWFAGQAAAFASDNRVFGSGTSPDSRDAALMVLRAFATALEALVLCARNALVATGAAPASVRRFHERARVNAHIESLVLSLPPDVRAHPAALAAFAEVDDLSRLLAAAATDSGGARSWHAVDLARAPAVTMAELRDALVTGGAAARPSGLREFNVITHRMTALSLAGATEAAALRAALFSLVATPNAAVSSWKPVATVVAALEAMALHARTDESRWAAIDGGGGGGTGTGSGTGGADTRVPTLDLLGLMEAPLVRRSKDIRERLTPLLDDTIRRNTAWADAPPADTSDATRTTSSASAPGADREPARAQSTRARAPATAAVTEAPAANPLTAAQDRPRTAATAPTAASSRGALGAQSAGDTSQPREPEQRVRVRVRRRRRDQSGSGTGDSASALSDSVITPNSSAAARAVRAVTLEATAAGAAATRNVATAASSRAARPATPPTSSAVAAARARAQAAGAALPTASAAPSEPSDAPARARSLSPTKTPTPAAAAAAAAAEAAAAAAKHASARLDAMPSALADAQARHRQANREANRQIDQLLAQNTALSESLARARADTADARAELRRAQAADHSGAAATAALAEANATVAQLQDRLRLAEASPGNSDSDMRVERLERDRDRLAALLAESARELEGARARAEASDARAAELRNEAAMARGRLEESVRIAAADREARDVRVRELTASLAERDARLASVRTDALAAADAARNEIAVARSEAKAARQRAADLDATLARERASRAETERAASAQAAAVAARAAELETAVAAAQGDARAALARAALERTRAETAETAAEVAKANAAQLSVQTLAIIDALKARSLDAAVAANASKRELAASHSERAELAAMLAALSDELDCAISSPVIRDVAAEKAATHGDATDKAGAESDAAASPLVAALRDSVLELYAERASLLHALGYERAQRANETRMSNDFAAELDAAITVPERRDVSKPPRPSADELAAQLADARERIAELVKERAALGHVLELSRGETARERAKAASVSAALDAAAGVTDPPRLRDVAAAKDSDPRVAALLDRLADAQADAVAATEAAERESDKRLALHELLLDLAAELDLEPADTPVGAHEIGALLADALAERRETQLAAERVRAEHVAALRTISMLKSQLSETQSRLDDTTAELTSTHANVDESLGQLDATIGAMRAQLVELEQAKLAGDRRVAELERALVDREVAAVAASAAAPAPAVSTATLEAAAAAATAATEAAAEAELTNRALAQRLLTLQMHGLELEGELEAARAEAAAASARLRTAESALQQAVEKNVALEQERRDAASALGAHEATRQRMALRVAELQRENATMSAERSELLLHDRQLSERVQTLKSALEQLQTDFFQPAIVS